MKMSLLLAGGDLEWLRPCCLLLTVLVDAAWGVLDV